MIKQKFFQDYHKEFVKTLKLDDEILQKLVFATELIVNNNKKKGTVYLLGNGGSNAITSHTAIDFTKNAKIKASSFTDGSIITCLSNDFGHDNWMAKALEIYCANSDLIIFISSSGNSKNIVNAAKYCVENNIRHISFTGMEKANSLNKICDRKTNFWVDSFSYNMIEMAHQFYLLAIVDKIIGKTVYKAS